MSERIRYRKVSEFKLESVRSFSHPCNGATYKVHINTTEPLWEIVETGCDIVAASGRNVKLPDAQLEIRAALKMLGIVLNTENRKERTKKV